MLASERRERYLTSGISEINANKIIQNRKISDYLNKYLDKNINLVIASNLLLGDIASYLNKANVSMEDTKFTEDKFVNIVNRLDKGDISSKIFKEILNDLFETDADIDLLLDKHGISKLSDEDLRLIIRNILDNNKDNVTEYKNGNERVLKYFVGQVMKETKGSANPILLNEILLDELSK